MYPRTFAVYRKSFSNDFSVNIPPTIPWIAVSYIKLSLSCEFQYVLPVSYAKRNDLDHLSAISGLESPSTPEYLPHAADADKVYGAKGAQSNMITGSLVRERVGRKSCAILQSFQRLESALLRVRAHFCII